MGKKKEKKKKDEIIIDGVKTSEMTREQLEAFALRLKEETDREREERNYFQIERDKLRTYWELTKDQLDEAKAQLRNMDREMEAAREKTADEMKLFKQRIKHLTYEQQTHISELRASEMVNLKLAQDEHYAQQAQLQQDKTDLKQKLTEQQLAFEETYANQQLNFSKEVSKIREEFEGYAKELEVKYEKKFGALRSELGLKHRMEMAEVEERKNRQINELMERHQRDFGELKNYYNDITLNNLALIASLKEQVDLQVEQIAKVNKQLTEVKAENKSLRDPLEKAQNEAKDLRRMMQNYEKDKQSLRNTKTLLTTLQKKYDDLQWENSTLQMRFDQLGDEHKQLEQKFVNAVLELQRKTALKSVLLQKKVQTLTESLEERNAMLTKCPGGESSVEEIVREKNNKIQDLEYELARVCKMHDDLIQTYEAKLLKFGIPKEELGFVTLRASKGVPANLGKGPAGLVTKNK